LLVPQADSSGSTNQSVAMVTSVAGHGVQVSAGETNLAMLWITEVVTDNVWDTIEKEQRAKPVYR